MANIPVKLLMGWLSLGMAQILSWRSMDNNRGAVWCQGCHPLLNQRVVRVRQFCALGCSVGLWTSGRWGNGAVDATSPDKHHDRNQGKDSLTLPMSYVTLTPEKWVIFIKDGHGKSIFAPLEDENDRIQGKTHCAVIYDLFLRNSCRCLTLVGEQLWDLHLCLGAGRWWIFCFLQLGPMPWVSCSASSPSALCWKSLGGTCRVIFFLQISAVNNVSAWADFGRLMGILPPCLFPPPQLSLAGAKHEPGRISPASCAWLCAWGTACSASPLRFDLELCKPRACLKWKRVLFAQCKMGNVIIKRGRHWESKEKASLS